MEKITVISEEKRQRPFKHFVYRATDGKLYTRQELAKISGLSISSINARLSKYDFSQPITLEPYECKHLVKKGQTVRCANCNQKFTRIYNSAKKYCSTSCRDEARWDTQVTDEWRMMGDYDRVDVNDLVHLEPTHYEAQIW